MNTSVPTPTPTIQISMDVAGGNNGLYPIVTDLSDLESVDTTTDDSGMIRTVVTVSPPFADLQQQQQQHQQTRRRKVLRTPSLKLKTMVGHRRSYSEGTVSFLFPEEDGSCSGSGNTEEESTSSSFTAFTSEQQQQPEDEDRSDRNRRFEDLYVLTQRVSIITQCCVRTDAYNVYYSTRTITLGEFHSHVFVPFTTINHYRFFNAITPPSGSACIERPGRDTASKSWIKPRTLPLKWPCCKPHSRHRRNSPCPTF